MATAETARLVASLELQDKNFTRGLRNVERGVGRVDKKLSAFGGFVNRNLARGIDTFAASLVGGVFKGVESLKELEQQQAQTAAVLKSTGQAAGITGEQVTALAEKFEGLNAVVGDEFIRGAENMLLTFTNIKDDAFEPTLAAVLDLNTAMGKGPEGLTSTAIQVGKALNDPTTGLTALRRVGVAFTKDQQKKIKSLQKEGKLYEAQQLILKELNKEFGGSFAAQGDTTAGKVAKFHDAIEDLQRTFAKALLPIIVKVADKLGALFADPKVVAVIDEAGKGLARAFDGVLSAAEKINWGAIAGGLEKAAGFAGDLVGWFGKFPDWAQALIVGGFVATRLPIIGDVFSEAAKGLIKGVLGINAGIVNVNGPVAGGAPVPGGGGNKLYNLLKTGITVAIAAASIVALAEAFKGFIDLVGESQKDLNEKVDKTNTQGFKETIGNLQAVTKSIKNMNPLENVLAGIFGGSEIVKNYEMAADRIVKQLAAGELNRDEMVTALTALQDAVETSPEAELPGVESAIDRLTKAIRGTPTGDPKQPLPRGPVPHTEAKPGDNLFKQLNALNATTNKQFQDIGALKERQDQTRQEIATKGDATRNAITTMDVNQKAAIVAQTAVNTAGNIAAAFQSVGQILATGTTTQAVNTNASATRGVAPPIVSTLLGVQSAITTAIWGARPVIQSTNVVNNYTQQQRTGASSGSRQAGWDPTH